MTLLHFDCFSGASGDMILGALVDAGLPFKDLVHGLKSVSIDTYDLKCKTVMRGGLTATKVEVVVRDGFRSPIPLSRIQRIIASSQLPPGVKDRSREVFDRLARAEGAAHRVSPSDVQFHEIGVVDSIVDVMGTVLGCHLLGGDTDERSADHDVAQFLRAERRLAERNREAVAKALQRSLMEGTMIFRGKPTPWKHICE